MSWALEKLWFIPSGGQSAKIQMNWLLLVLPIAFYNHFLLKYWLFLHTIYILYTLYIYKYILYIFINNWFFYQANANEFQQTSRNLKRKMWWKNLKMMLIIGIVAVIVLIIIIVAAVEGSGGGGNSSSGGNSDPTKTAALMSPTYQTENNFTSVNQT